MKILLCHNYYQQAGGEDQVFADETWLLESHGHEVIRYLRHNDDVDELSNYQKLRKTLWNPDTVRDLGEVIRRERPDVMHCTNTFPLISPAAYAVARQHGVRVVQSIHNYRLLCTAATLMRQDRVCEDCVGKFFSWPAVVHKCYRENRGATSVLALYQAFHRLRRTWHRDVDRFIALTEFSRDKLVMGGLPADRVDVKRNFVHPDPGAGTGQGDYFLFVGRLSQEKGIGTLLRAWSSHPDLPTLRLLGDGPLADDVRQADATLANVEWIGRRPLDEVYRQMGQAQAVIVPSVWYEVCPKTILEAFATGTPVIASRLGGMAELVTDGETGVLFEAGNAEELAKAVRSLAADASRRTQLRQAARRAYLERYTPQENYRLLLKIYQKALGAVHADAKNR